MFIKDAIILLETLAPSAYQESYDNCGLLTGSPETEVTGILITLDCLEAVVDEAISEKCNLIIAHHPILFKGLKKINGDTYIERTIIKAIKNDIAIYAMHTNLDNVKHGVNYKIAEKLGLKDVKILSPRKQVLKKLITFVPQNETDTVLNSLYEAGAGNIGNYSECSFSIAGKGTFKPNEEANPSIGKADTKEVVEENRIEVIFPAYLESAITKALYSAHPYETPAYDILLLENKNEEVGSGSIGILPSPIPEVQFLEYLKSQMKLSCIRHTNLKDKNIQKVAICGGAGSFLLQTAISAQADVFVSSDFKYHEFFDADNKIVIADIGHYESEVFTKDLIYEFLSKKISNIAVRLSKVDTNPIRYV